MSVVKSQISDGALTATTGLAYQTKSHTQTQTQAQSTATAAGGSATSTSSSAAAPTGLTVSVMGALGVLGLALAL